MQRKLLLLQLVLLLFTYVNSDAQDYRPSVSISAKQARVLATEQLPSVLQWMEPEDLSLYGFSATDDFSKITVGRPFYLSSMDEVLQANKGILQIRSMMMPLILENTVRCFIYVSYEEGKWKAVGIGSMQYAVKGGGIFNKSDDNASWLISILQMNEEFIADNSKGTMLFKPILHINKEIVKEGYSMNELTSLFTESVNKVK